MFWLDGDEWQWWLRVPPPIENTVTVELHESHDPAPRDQPPARQSTFTKHRAVSARPKRITSESIGPKYFPALCELFFTITESMHL
jgi:hypothetical protein